MDGWKTNSFPFGDLAYFQVLLLLLVLREVVVCSSHRLPPKCCASTPTFRVRTTWAVPTEPLAVPGAAPAPAAPAPEGGKRPAAVRATGAKAGLEFSHSQGKLAVFQVFLKLALYIIPIYLGSGWSNWSDMYNVCTEISIPWVAESTTFFSRFQISVHIWLPLEVFGFQHTGATVPTTGISLDSNIANWNWEVQLSKVPATNLAMASYTNELLNCYLSPRVRIY